MIAPMQLQRIFPALRNASEVANALAPACERFSINNPARLAAFIAQAGHESAEFRATRENLNYSAKGLLATWPRRFDVATARALARKPEAIANYVYANRLGNGNVVSGDGWRYRGGGYIQTTGRENYRKTGAAIGLPLEDQPELIVQPTVAALSAAWFWQSRGLNELADDLPDDDDNADFVAITRRINGGTIGLHDRKALWRIARKVLGA